MVRIFQISDISLISIFTKPKKIHRSRRGSWSFSVIVNETIEGDPVKKELQVGFSPQASEFMIENCIDSRRVYQEEVNEDIEYDIWLSKTNCLTYALDGKTCIEDNSLIIRDIFDRIKERIRRLILNSETWKLDKKNRPFVRDARYGTLTIHDMGRI